MVDLDLAALFGGKPRLFKRKPIGVGLPAYRHEHDSGRYRLGLAACGGHPGDGRSLALWLHLGDLGGGAVLHALLLPQLRHLVSELRLPAEPRVWTEWSR